MLKKNLFFFHHRNSIRFDFRFAVLIKLTYVHLLCFAAFRPGTWLVRGMLWRGGGGCLLLVF